MSRSATDALLSAVRDNAERTLQMEALLGRTERGLRALHERACAREAVLGAFMEDKGLRPGIDPNPPELQKTYAYVRVEPTE